MAIILDSKQLLKMNKENEQTVAVSGFSGNPEALLKNSNAELKEGKLVKMNTLTMEGSEGFVKNTKALRDTLIRYNATQLPEDRTALYDLVYIDLARRILQQPDLTGFMDNIVTNANFTESVLFKDFADFDAIFDTIAGTGDSADLIELQLGDKTTVVLEINGVGWRDSLINTLFNQDYGYVQKVLNAVARGYVAKKNALALNDVINTTYDASMSVAADATGSSPEEKLYITLNTAIELINSLKDPLDGDLIDAGDIALLVNPQDSRRINRAINGVINNNADQVNRTALTEIATIVPYKGKTLRMGKKKVTYSGVTKNEAYMFIPKMHRYSLVKTGLVSMQSQGDATSFSQKERAWYFVGGRYDDLFFGSSNATVKAKIAEVFDDSGEGYGYIVKVALPA